MCYSHRSLCIYHVTATLQPLFNAASIFNKLQMHQIRIGPRLFLSFLLLFHHSLRSTFVHAQRVTSALVCPRIVRAKESAAAPAATVAPALPAVT